MNKNLPSFEEFSVIVEEMVSLDLLERDEEGKFALSDGLLVQLKDSLGKTSIVDFTLDYSERKYIMIIRSIMKHTYPKVKDQKQILDYYNIINAYLYASLSEVLKDKSVQNYRGSTEELAILRELALNAVKEAEK